MKYWEKMKNDLLKILRNVGVECSDNDGLGKLWAKLNDYAMKGKIK